MKEKITYGQFAALLFISDAFALMCMSGSLTVVTVFCFIGAILIQAATVIPAVSYAHKNTKSAAGAPESSPRKDTVLHWVYLIFAVFWGGLLFVRVWRVSEFIYLPPVFPHFITDRAAISALIAAAVFYVSSLGVKPLGRASVIASAFGALCILVIILGAIGNINLEYVSFSNSDSIFGQIVQGLSMGGGIAGFLILLETLDSNPIKTTLFYFGGKIIITSIIMLIAIAVTGGIMSIIRFPVMTAAQLSQPFNSQRLDSIFIVIFVVLAILSIAVQASLSAFLLGTLFPKFRKFKSSVSICAMLLSALMLSRINLYSVTISVIVLCISVLPAIIFMTRRVPQN